MSNSRLEKFIYAICGMDVDDLPTPLSRIETLWNCLITGEMSDFEPLSRNEKYLMAMLNGDIDGLPEPTSRSEKLLYKITTGETDLSDVPGYLSGYEELLKQLIENGGIGGTDFEYVLYTLKQPLSTLYSTAEAPVKSAILKGCTLVNLIKTVNFKITDNGFKNSQYSYAMDASKTYLLQYRVNQMAELSDNSDNGRVLKFEWYSGGSIGSHSNIYNKYVTVGKSETIIIKPFVGEVTRTTFGVWCPNYMDGTLDVDVMIIEYQQNMENWDIPYFTGMQSVKMPVLKTFNNIVDFSNDKLEFEYGVYFGQKGDGTDQVNNKGVPSSFVYTLNYINVLGNRDKMRFYGNDTIIDRVVWFDENKNQIGLSLGYNNRTVAIPTGTKYFRFLLNDSRFIEDKELAKKNIGHYNFYYGDENKSFSNEPYKSNILSTPEDLVMRSNGNVYDELDLITGKFIQRIDESNEVLAQEVVKTVVLSTLDQDGQPTKLSTFNDITHVSIEAGDLLPTIDLEVATKIEETLSTLPTLMNDISETQQLLNESIDDQAENINEVSTAITEIRSDIL